MVLFFDVQVAVAVMMLPNLVSNIFQGWQYRRTLLPARFSLGFAVAGALGAVAGSVLLAKAPPDLLLLTMSGAVFGYIALRLARPGWVLGYETARRMVWPAGLAGGILQGAVGISAPVSVTFLNAMRLTRDQFIANIALFFAVLTAVQLPVLWAYGIFDGRRAVYSLAAIVPLLAFMPVGRYIARFLPPPVFDKVILAVLAIIAARMVLRAFQ